MNNRFEFDFALTTYCQAKCRSCVRTDLDTGEPAEWLKPKHMDPEFFKKCVENLKGLTVDAIEFCGELGDPMMHPQVRYFIDYALTVCDEVVISTNGGLRTPDFYIDLAAINRLRKSPARVTINWGIDGVTHNINDMYRTGVNFNRAMDNMISWFSNGGKGQWMFLVFEWNVHQIRKAKKIAEENNINIDFKINSRYWGKIRPNQIHEVEYILKDIGHA